MSHFTTVATKITNLTSLLRALDRLKLKYQVAHEAQAELVRGWTGQTTTAG